jgi:hypothetical protein
MCASAREKGTMTLPLASSRMARVSVPSSRAKVAIESPEVALVRLDDRT